MLFGQKADFFLNFKPRDICGNQLALEVATKLILRLIFSLRRKSCFIVGAEGLKTSEALVSSEDGSRMSLRIVDLH